MSGLLTVWLWSLLTCVSSSEKIRYGSQFMQVIKNGRLPSFPELFPQLQKALTAGNISQGCQNSVTDFFTSLSKGEKWSIQMVDASANIPSGILSGNLMELGSYEQCLRVRSTGPVAFRGRYCLVGYQPRMISQYHAKNVSRQNYLGTYGHPPDWIEEYISTAGMDSRFLKLMLGTCIPSTCSEEELKKTLSVALNPLGVDVSITACYVEEPTVWPTSVVISIGTFIILAVLCLLGTIFDFLTTDSTSTKLNHPSILLVKSFSIPANLNKLFGGRIENDVYGCFHGLRFFTTLCVILGHAYGLIDILSYLRYGSYFRRRYVFSSFYMPIVENGILGSSIFFYMSGFFLMYAEYTKLVKNEGQVSLFWFTFMRIFRMTPNIAFVLTLLLTMQVMNTGPLWKPTMDFYVERCNKNWWATFLYINNLWDTPNICLGQTWYFSTLMQLHLIGIALLILFYRRPVLGVITGLAMIALGFFLDMWIMYQNDYHLQRFGHITDQIKGWMYIFNVFYKPTHHVSAYFIGMTVAYIFLKYKDIKLRPIYHVIGWVLSAFLASFALWGIYGPETILYKALYTASFRIAFATAVGWLTFACISGSGGFINRFLSWRVFVPLGNLSQSCCLLHFLFDIYLKASQNERQFYGQLDFLTKTISLIVMGYLLALVEFLAVEAPFVRLGVILFGKYSSPKKKTL